MRIKPIKAFRVLSGLDNTNTVFPDHFEEINRTITQQVRPFTMTSI